jgi:hypothetical protein
MAQIVGPRVASLLLMSPPRSSNAPRSGGIAPHHFIGVCWATCRALGCIHDGQGTIDVAYARWVFCFLNNPESVVEGLAALVKQGGRVAIHDYFNYDRCLTLAPRREAFSKVIHAVGASWRARGGDTDVMGRLPGLFQKHGFEVTHLDVIQRIAR